MKILGINIGRDSALQNELEDTRIGYKVVSRENSKSFSPATRSALQSFRYRISRETRRDPDQSGPIAIFDSLEHAEEFAGTCGGHILKVEYVPSEEQRLWKKNPPVFVKNGWGGGYHAESNGISEMEDGFPAGTIFAESVYPLEQIA